MLDDKWLREFTLNHLRRMRFGLEAEVDKAEADVDKFKGLDDAELDEVRDHRDNLRDELQQVLDVIKERPESKSLKEADEGYFIISSADLEDLQGALDEFRRVLEHTAYVRLRRQCKSIRGGNWKPAQGEWKLIHESVADIIYKASAKVELLVIGTPEHRELKCWFDSVAALKAEDPRLS